MLGEVYDVLPPGVVNIITGAGDTGQALTNHPDVDMIAFTGSTPVGKHIAAAAGAQLKKINLELGGIDPLIVFEDADLDVASRGAVWARLLNAGQVCTSSKRIYVVESIAQDFKARGRTSEPEVAIRRIRGRYGAVDLRRCGRKLEQQSRRCAEGAQLLVGGRCSHGLKGHFSNRRLRGAPRHATTEELFRRFDLLVRTNEAIEGERFRIRIGIRSTRAPIMNAP
jgi:acyl-CoA reductase-like NAD-dependent aldehyde dehydrogenase